MKLIMYETEGIDSRVSSSECAQKISSKGIDRDYFLLSQYDAEGTSCDQACTAI